MKGRKLRLHGNPKAYCEGVMVMVIALFSVVCGHFFFFLVSGIMFCFPMFTSEHGRESEQVVNLCILYSSGVDSALDCVTAGPQRVHLAVWEFVPFIPSVPRSICFIEQKLGRTHVGDGGIC